MMVCRKKLWVLHSESSGGISPKEGQLESYLCTMWKVIRTSYHMGSEMISLQTILVKGRYDTVMRTK